MKVIRDVPILRWAPTIDRRRLDPDQLNYRKSLPIRVVTVGYRDGRDLVGMATDIAFTDDGVNARIALKTATAELAAKVDLWPCIDLQISQRFLWKDGFIRDEADNIMLGGELIGITLGSAPVWDLPSLRDLLAKEPT